MTTITADDQYRNVCRISRTGFTKVIYDLASPAVVAERNPGEYWDACQQYGCDPLFALAIFQHESGMGKNGTAVTTHSWGNTRTPNFGATPVGTVPGRTGTFPVWANWRDGCISTVARLTDPTYVYAGRNIGQVYTVDPSWAPAGDLNDPAGYLASVLAFMNQYQDGGVMANGRDGIATWAPSSNFDSGRDGYTVSHITDHMTAGTDSLNWLRGQAGGSSNTQSSSSYLIERDGTLYQLVDENDTEWADGDLPYNRSGISIEHESADGTFTEPQIVASIALHVRIAQRRGWTKLAHPGYAVEPETVPTPPAGTGYVYGHSQIPDPNNPAAGGGIDHHTGCPGAQFPFDRIISTANAQLAGQPAPAPQPTPDNQYFPETQHNLSHGFLRFWQEHGGVPIFGLPLSEEFTGPQGFTVQWFERAQFQYQPSIAGNQWGVVLARLGANDLKDDQAKFPGPFKPVQP